MINEIKKKIRKEMAQEKKNFCASSLYEMSQSIWNSIEQNPLFINCKTVLLYHSLNDEVATHDFIEKWFRVKQIILPVVKGDDLELRIYNGKEDMIKGAYEIWEPCGQTFIDYSKIDLALIPGVAFDKEGNRLGRGKGYYDRLLPKIDAFKIGICFPFQYLEHIPHEPFDIRMDEIVCR